MSAAIALPMPSQLPTETEAKLASESSRLLAACIGHGEAARLRVNVSRPFLVGLVESGELPFRKVGTHRRIMFKDLMEYRSRSQINRKAALDELTRQAQELSIGY